MPGPRAERLAARALARDKRIAAAQVKRIRSTFRAEMRAVLREASGRNDPARAVTVERWRETLGDLWVDVGEQVYPQAVEDIGGPPVKAAGAQLVALVQQIVQSRRPATEVRRFTEEMAQGIVTSSRRRIHTVLRDGNLRPAEVREVTRVLRKLYTTDFVQDRSARIALDQVLRASATFENAAAQQVAVSTGRTYMKHWLNQGDAKVRSEHQGVEAVALNEDFKVDGVALRYPRDPAGPAYLTANCRCWVEHVRV